MTKSIKHQLIIFLIVGLLTILIDFLVYRSLLYLNLFGIDSANMAKGLSFIVGTIFAYFANRFWTFNNRNASVGSIGRFILVYICGLSFNVLGNHLCTNWLSNILRTPESVIAISFLFATSISATLNFIGMKFFVFTDHEKYVQPNKSPN